MHEIDMTKRPGIMRLKPTQKNKNYVEMRYECAKFQRSCDIRLSLLHGHYILMMKSQQFVPNDPEAKLFSTHLDSLREALS